MEIIKGIGGTAPDPPGYVERLRVADVSFGTDVIAAGAAEQAVVGAGDVVHVPAGETHRFVGIEETLRMLVFFTPAYQSRGPDRPARSGPA